MSSVVLNGKGSIFFLPRNVVVVVVAVVAVVAVWGGRGVNPVDL